MRIAGWRYPVIVDLAGLAIPSQNRPIRFGHDMQSGVGHTDAIQIEDGRLVATGVVSRDTAAAREIVASARNGFPWQASIGAAVEEFEFVKPRPEGAGQRPGVLRAGERRPQGDARRDQFRGPGGRRPDQRERGGRWPPPSSRRIRRWQTVLLWAPIRRPLPRPLGSRLSPRHRRRHGARRRAGAEQLPSKPARAPWTRSAPRRRPRPTASPAIRRLCAGQHPGDRGPGDPRGLGRRRAANWKSCGPAGPTAPAVHVRDDDASTAPCWRRPAC